MKKVLIIAALLLTSFAAGAQTYTIVSRSNDTIKLYSNKAGDALKSVLPGAKTEVNYRLISKMADGKNSLLFVELPLQVENFLTTYETDLVDEGKWRTTVYTIKDIYKCVSKENAILYKGSLLGMNVEIHLRPSMFSDVIVIDGIVKPSPIKISNLINKIEAEEDLETTKQNQLYQSAADLELTEEDVKTAQQCPNDYYVAYLISENIFDNTVDKSLLKEITDNNSIMKIIGEKKYNSKQLKFLSAGYDKRLDKYKRIYF